MNYIFLMEFNTSTGSKKTFDSFFLKSYCDIYRWFQRLFIIGRISSSYIGEIRRTKDAALEFQRVLLWTAQFRAKNVKSGKVQSVRRN